MLDTLIEQIQEAVKPEIIEIGGVKYSSRELRHIPDDPLAKAVQTTTLQSVVDYINGNIDETTDTEENGKVFIHVAAHNLVRVCAFLNADRNREILLEAKYESNNFRFGGELDQETFITLLQSSFVDSVEREKIQKLVGGLVEDSSVKLTDDGISQQTVAKSGVTMVERTKIENPIILAPHRTFAEIVQPDSPFILRLHRSNNAPPTISLTEADNSRWKIAAIEGIKEFLAAEIETPIIG